MLNVDALIAFAAVIDTGSFSAAAERLGQTPSGVSRTISRLEAQLGMTLMQRTTRRLDLTEEGDASTPALDHMLAPLVADFLDAYPLVKLEMVSGETVVDLIEERADLAIRIGQLADSTLNARRLGGSRLRLLASPAYLRKHGAPAGCGDLAHHRLLGFTAPASLNIWPLMHDGSEGMPITPAVLASSGSTLRQLALSGAGIVSLSDFLTGADLAAGTLVPVLEHLTLPWSQPVWAVFYKQGALAPRVAALVDFLAQRLASDQVLEV